MVEMMPASAELDGILKPIGILKLPKDWHSPEVAPEPTTDLNGHHAPKLLTPSDVADMALYLGIDLERESYLLPVAREAVLAELPAGWHEKLDEDGGVQPTLYRQTYP
jgi:hypothetical protein